MKLNVARRIVREDFNQKDQELVDKLAYPINQFMEQMIQGLNKNITIEDNLPFELKTFTISVDADGIPTNTLAFKTSVLRIKGMIVVRADNVEDATPFTGAPFPQFTLNGNLLTIQRLMGLPADKDCSVTVLVIG